ncbi:MAG: hypothetical protein R3C32_10365 [Chloroflexota bacterium]
MPQTIPVGGSYSCTVPESLLGEAGDTESDTVTVTAEDDEGNVVTDTDAATFTITDLIPQIAVDKTATPATVPEPGGDVTFTVTVSNDSPEQVTQLTLDDDVYGDLDGHGSCVTPVVLAPVGQPGDTYACTFTEFVTNNAGESSIDIVTASGVDDEGNVVEGSDSATVTVTDSPPTIVVTKTANPTERLEPGGQVFYTMAIENPSSEPVTITTMVDVPYGSLDGQGGCSLPQTIPPGGTYVCSFPTTVTGNAGDLVTDTVTVTGVDDEGTPTSDSDDATVTILDVPPSMDVTKSASPGSVPPPGGEVTFTVSVHNASRAEALTLTSLVDAPYGDVTDPTNPALVATTCSVPQAIASDATYTCSFRVFVPWVAGGSTDVVTATGEDDDGNSITDTDGAYVGPGAPGVTMTKSASPSTLPEPGGLVTFSVTVTADGPGGTLVQGIVDDPYGDVTDPSNTDIVATDCVVPQSIPQGGSYTCSFQAQVTGEPGTYVDTVSVRTPGGTMVDDATVVLTDVLPAGSVTKTASPNPIMEPGRVVTYAIAVANASTAEALELTSLLDDVHGDITDPTNPRIVSTTCTVPQTIAIAATYTCTFDAEAFGDAGQQVTDYVFAATRDNEGNPLDLIDTETVTIEDAPLDFVVTKVPSPPTLPEPGGSVRYGVTVRNMAPEPLQVTDLVDVQGGVPLDLSGQGSCLVTQTIPPGGTYVCSFTRDANGNAGDTVGDTVTATGRDNEGNTEDRSADASVRITAVPPRLTVQKNAIPASVPEPGGAVTYAVTITNTSVATDPITIQTLADSVAGGPFVTPPDLACSVAGSPVSTPFVLQPGAAASCTFGGTVTGDAGASTSDTFRATGVDDEGTAVTGAGSATVPVTDVRPTMTVVKAATPNPVPEPGGTVTFTATVTNTSPETIVVTGIRDDVAGTLAPGTCTPPVAGIAPGGSYVCTWTGVVTGDVGDVQSNIVTVTARDNEGNVVQVSDQEDTVVSDVLPTNRLTKTATPASNARARWQRHVPGACHQHLGGAHPDRLRRR